MKLKNIPGVLADAVLIFCCAIASAVFVPTAFEAFFTLKPLLIFEAASALLISFLFHLIKKEWPIEGLLLLYIAALIFFAFCREIINGAKLVWYSSGKVLSLDFSFLPTPNEPVSALDPVDCVTKFLLLEAFVVSIAAGLLLIECRSPIPSLTLPLPFIAVGFVYTDCPPARYAVILLLIYWVGALFGRELLKTRGVSLGFGKLLFLAMLVGLAVLIPKISPEEKYDAIPFSERKGLLDSFGDFQDRLLSGSESNPKEYDLSGEGERNYAQVKAFLANSTVAGTFYLRMHSYGLYGGNVWKSSEEYKGNWVSLERLGKIQGVRTEYLRIRDARMSERLTPYGFLGSEELKVGESFIRASGRSAYVWSFKPSINFIPAAVTEYEKEYYQFALEHYTLPDGELKDMLLGLLDTELPYLVFYYDDDVTTSTYSIIVPRESTEEYTFPALVLSDNAFGRELSLCTENTITTVDPDANPYMAATLVARYVSMSATYDLVPGRAPASRDFVEFFMNDLKKGYCVHFASTTTAILQALGIPARYVVGYRAVLPEAETWIEINKEKSHAWTEIYLMGVGWVPIESTAGLSSQLGFTPYNYQDPFAPDATPTPSPTPIPDDDMPSHSPTPRPTKVPLELPTTKPSETRKPVSGNEPVVKKTRTKLWWLLSIPAAILLWEAVGVVIRKLRKRRFTQSNSKNAVLAMLKYLDSLKRYGAPLPKNAEALENEALFSNHSMKQAQKELYKHVEDVRFRLYRRLPAMRFILRWITFKI